MSGPNAKVDPAAMPDPLVAVTGWTLTDAATRPGIHAETSGTELVLELRTAADRAARLVARAVSPNTWKLALVPEGIEPPQPTPMVVPRDFRPVRIRTKVTKTGRLLVTGPELSLEIGLDPFSFRFLDRQDRPILSDNPGDVDGIGRPAVLRLGFSVSPDGSPAGVTASFHLRPGEHLYGLGEKFTRLDKAGQRIVSWTVDALGSTSERSHKNVPFLWSTRGAGVFLDTGARIAWDLGAASLQSWTFTAETPALDMYVFHGPRPDRILAAYTALTGRPPAVPDWSFGLWLSSGGTYRDQASIEALLDGIERHRVPASVVHIDPWWMRWRKYCDF
jgi:alpha-D-xyloside xylohydrolase